MSITRCDFCGRGEDLVIGPGIAICRHCVVIAFDGLKPSEIIAARQEIESTQRRTRMRSWEEARQLISEVDTVEETGESRYPGMKYEEGIRDAIVWVYGAEKARMDEPDEWPFDGRERR